MEDCVYTPQKWYLEKTSFYSENSILSYNVLYCICINHVYNTKNIKKEQKQRKVYCIHHPIKRRNVNSESDSHSKPNIPHLVQTVTRNFRSYMLSIISHKQETYSPMT